MWNREERTEERTAAPRPRVEVPVLTACIGKSIVIKGNVTSSENLTVNGRVEGTIDLGGHRLIVGAGGSVDAAISAGVITISGAVTGDVTGHDKVEISPTGSVDGNISAPRLVVAEGALLRGRLDTHAASLAAQADQPRRLSIAV